MIAHIRFARLNTGDRYDRPLHLATPSLHRSGTSAGFQRIAARSIGFHNERGGMLLKDSPQSNKDGFKLGIHFCAGSEVFLRFHTDKVRPSPGVLVKSVGRSEPGDPKQNFAVSPSIS